MDLRNELIEFLDSIRDYVRESGTNIAHDERESSEFVDTHLRSKLRQGAVSDSVCDHKRTKYSYGTGGSECLDCGKI